MVIHSRVAKKRQTQTERFWQLCTCWWIFYRLKSYILQVLTRCDHPNEDEQSYLQEKASLEF